MTDSAIQVVTTAPLGSETWAAELRKLTQAAFQTTEESYTRLARLLNLVARSTVGGVPGALPIYTLWGFKTFDEWAEQDLKVHPRRARALRAIAECVDHHLAAVPEETRIDLYGLGWGKLRLLVRTLTPNNASKWLGVAKTVSIVTLEKMVQTAVSDAAKTPAKSPKGSAASPPGPVVDAEVEEGDTSFAPPAVTPTVVFRRFALFETQAALVDAALERAAQVSGSDKPGYGLTVVAQAFLANIPFEGAETARRTFLEHLAETLGVRIITLEPGTENVLEDVSP